ncbi:hypothetical protein [Actinokineospora inagensis]|nr:hypothetical protein [Actinokineospora inagensis]
MKEVASGGDYQDFGGDSGKSAGIRYRDLVGDGAKSGTKPQ